MQKLIIITCVSIKWQIRHVILFRVVPDSYLISSYNERCLFIISSLSFFLFFFNKFVFPSFVLLLLLHHQHHQHRFSILLFVAFFYPFLFLKLQLDIDLFLLLNNKIRIIFIYGISLSVFIYLLLHCIYNTTKTFIIIIFTFFICI